MSTPRENLFSPTENILCVTNFVVQKEQLGDAVKRIRREKKLSLEDVRNRSRQKLATSYINRIENGEVDAEVISVGKLRDLANGLGEPVTSLIDIAIGLDRQNQAAESRLHLAMERLTPSRMADLARIAEAFYEEIEPSTRIRSAEARNVTVENLGKVVAHPESKKMVERMVFPDELEEIERRTTPRKRKTG